MTAHACFLSPRRSLSGGPQPGKREMEGFGSASYDVMYPAGWQPAAAEDSEDSETDDAGGEGVRAVTDPDLSPAPAGAAFETLKDGSTALVVSPGWRLRLQLGDLTAGGDEKKAERVKAENIKAKAAAKRKRRAAKSGGFDYGGYGSYDYGAKDKWFKETLGEWTVTMDVKLGDAPPREGVALLHTAL
jgi:hypothetical protein